MLNSTAKELVDSLQDGEGLHIEKHPQPASKVTARQVEELNKVPGVVHIILHYLRPNAPDFLREMEETLFPPETDLNELLFVHVIKWKHALWWVMTIPISYVNDAMRIADKHQFVLRPTVPVVAGIGQFNLLMSFSKEKKHLVPDRLDWFPIDTNTLTMEGKQE